MFLFKQEDECGYRTDVVPPHFGRDVTKYLSRSY